MTTRKQWIDAAQGGGTVPVVRELVLDTDQPVSVLARLARGPFAFLLESVVGGERWARYTFLGTEPREAWRYTGRRVDRWTPLSGWQQAGETDDPLGHIGSQMRMSLPVTGNRYPVSGFSGGAVGYAGYDVVRSLERLPNGPPADPALPDALFIVADQLVVLDNVRSRAGMRSGKTLRASCIVIVLNPCS